MLSTRNACLLGSAILLAACGARTSLLVADQSGGAGGTGATASSTHATVSVVSSTSTGQGGQGGSSFDGQVISVAPNQSFLEAETSLWVHGSTVVAGWIAIPGGPQTSVMGYSISQNSGTTWSPPSAVSSPGGRDSSDPVITSDAQGNFYMAFVGFFRDPKGNPLDMHVYVAKAPAGSTAFGAPVEVSDPNESATLYDKPWITVTQNGSIVVSYANFDQATSFALTAAHSTDGITWQRSDITSDPTFSEFSNLSFLCADLAGPRVYSVFGTESAQNVFRIRESFSDDGGVSWHAPLEVAGPGTNEIVTFDDPTCVALGNDLSVLYGVSDMPATGMSESEASVAIKLAHVTSGTSVATRTDVQDSTTGALFIHPQITGDATGKLSVAYYAGQFDGDDNGTYRVGPVTWNGHGPTRAYKDPIFFTSKRGDPQWLGDYTGAVQLGDEVYTTFVVNEPTESHIAFAKVKPLGGL